MFDCSLNGPSPCETCLNTAILPKIYLFCQHFAHCLFSNIFCQQNRCTPRMWGRRASPQQKIIQFRTCRAKLRIHKNYIIVLLVNILMGAARWFLGPHDTLLCLDIQSYWYFLVNKITTNKYTSQDTTVPTSDTHVTLVWVSQALTAT